MRAHHKIVYFKRHTAACPVHKRRLTPAKARAFMDCPCPVWVVGRTPMGDPVPRQSTGVATAAEAERKMAEAVATARNEQARVLTHGLPLAEAIELYMEYRRERADTGEDTLYANELTLERLHDFCQTKGVVYVRELGIDMLDLFRVRGLTTLKKRSSKRIAIGHLKTFLTHALRRKWITEHLAAMIERQTTDHVKSMPFEAEEITRMFAAIGALKRGKGSSGYSKHPQSFALLLMLMLETGMRAGDAARFDPRLLVRGKKLWRYPFVPQKQRRDLTPKSITAYISDDLKRKIDACEWFSAERPFFYAPQAGHKYLSSQIYDRMNTLGKAAGVENCRPHRLRDTFAVNQLLAGVPLEDVSRLLGHSSPAITQTYYAAWTDDRENRLEDILTNSRTGTGLSEKTLDGTLADKRRTALALAVSPKRDTRRTVREPASHAAA